MSICIYSPAIGYHLRIFDIRTYYRYSGHIEYISLKHITGFQGDLREGIFDNSVYIVHYLIVMSEK